MKSLILLLLAILVLPAPALAATPKQIQTALAEKYEVTKRKLSGGLKAPGTVFHIREPGLYAEPPKARVPETIVRGGSFESQAASASGPERISLPIGEPMHIYSIQANRNRVRLHLGTVKQYERTVMGSPVQTHFQVAIVFEYEDGIEGVDVERVLADVYQVGVTPEEAFALPDMKLAIENLESEKAAEQDSVNSVAVAQEPISASETSARTPPRSAAEREAAKRKELSRNHPSVNFQTECQDLFIPEVREEKFRNLVPVFSMIVLNNSSNRYTVEYDMVYTKTADSVPTRNLFGTTITGRAGYSETLTETKKFSIRPGAFTKFTLIERNQTDGTDVDSIEAIDIFRCTTP